MKEDLPDFQVTRVAPAVCWSWRGLGNFTALHSIICQVLHEKELSYKGPKHLIRHAQEVDNLAPCWLGTGRHWGRQEQRMGRETKHQHVLFKANPLKSWYLGQFHDAKAMNLQSWQWHSSTIRVLETLMLKNTDIFPKSQKESDFLHASSLGLEAAWWQGLLHYR